MSRQHLPGGLGSVEREPKLPIFDFKLTISLWDLEVRGSAYKVLDSGLSIADVPMAGEDYALVVAPTAWNWKLGGEGTANSASYMMLFSKPCFSLFTFSQNFQIII